MLISERRNFVFIHNPKSGGTSIRRALLPFDTTGHFFWKFAESNGQKFDKAHLPLASLKSIYPEYFSIVEKTFCFMVVRDPYARAVSAFNESHSRLYQETFETGDTPARLPAYRQRLNQFMTNLGRAQTQTLSLDYRHFGRQFDFAYLEQKRVVDLVMKLEEWPDCLRQLAVFLPDIAKSLVFAGKINARVMPGHFTDYLDEASIANLNECYKEDFYVWGYPML
jgi:hypothetical protein